MGNNCGAHTFLTSKAKIHLKLNMRLQRVKLVKIRYCNQRGIPTEKAIALIVNGFSKDVLNKLPMEFAVEAQKLLEISLEGSVG
jgi:Fe-S cluster assembly protein SufB